jgi:alkanesulfonate monooxygenase
MHPYSAAKIVASLGFLYNRKIYLNMIAGGFRGDLFSLSDETAHDDRYKRLEEYTSVIKGLLRGGKPFSFTGEYYRLKNVVMKPGLPSELLPEVFVSGTSEAGARAGRSLDAVSVEYPQPGASYQAAQRQGKFGIRIGIIVAEHAEEAWQKAYQRFPGDSIGRIKHAMAMRISDSQWHKDLSALERQLDEGSHSYWLWPFKNYNTFCPYLVGSYQEVSNEIAAYLRAGFTSFILDIPREEMDLHQAKLVFGLAQKLRQKEPSG